MPVLPRLLATAAALSTALAVTAAPSGAQASIDTRAGRTSFGSHGQVGHYDEADLGPAFFTLGQTFRAPASGDGAAVSLHGFSFWLGAYSFAPPPSYAAYVMAWDGAKATGPVLYRSDVRTGPQWPAVMAEERFALAAPAALAPGQSYVAFLSAAELGAGAPFGEMALGWVHGADAYTDGRLWVAATDDFGALSTEAWTSHTAEDLAFRADFTPAVTTTPEPASWALMAGGLATILVFAGGRARRAHAAA
jgi:hypothetical protein